MHSASKKGRGDKMEILKSNKGSAMMINLIVRLLVALTLIMTTINFAGLFVHYQNVSYISRELAKTIEQDGCINKSVLNSQLTELKDSFNYTQTSYSVDASTFTCEGTRNCIQFRDEFTVTVKDKHEVHITDKIVLPFDITITKTGQSEVFWKR